MSDKRCPRCQNSAVFEETTKGGDIIPHFDGLDLYNKIKCVACLYEAPKALFQLYDRALIARAVLNQKLYPVTMENGAMVFGEDGPGFKMTDREDGS